MLSLLIKFHIKSLYYSEKRTVRSFQTTIIAVFYCITLTSATASVTQSPLDACVNTCNWAVQDTGRQELKAPCILGGYKYMDTNQNLQKRKIECTFIYNSTNPDYTGNTGYDWCYYGCTSYPTQ